MEVSGSNGSLGLENPALETEENTPKNVHIEIDEVVLKNGDAVTPEESLPNGKIQKVPSKHARFKIINHSQSNLSLDRVDGISNGSEERGRENNEDPQGVERRETLQLPPSGVLKRRTESYLNQQATHNSTHGFTTIGYSSTEAIPMTAFYRNELSLSNVGKQRPTLQELHKGNEKSNKRGKVCKRIYFIMTLRFQGSSKIDFYPSPDYCLPPPPPTPPSCNQLRKSPSKAG